MQKDKWKPSKTHRKKNKNRNKRNRFASGFLLNVAEFFTASYKIELFIWKKKRLHKNTFHFNHETSSVTTVQSTLSDTFRYRLHNSISESTHTHTQTHDLTTLRCNHGANRQTSPQINRYVQRWFRSMNTLRMIFCLKRTCFRNQAFRRNEFLIFVIVFGLNCYVYLRFFSRLLCLFTFAILHFES